MSLDADMNRIIDKAELKAAIDAMPDDVTALLLSAAREGDGLSFHAVSLGAISPLVALWMIENFKRQLFED